VVEYANFEDTRCLQMFLTIWGQRALPLRPELTDSPIPASATEKLVENWPIMMEEDDNEVE